MANVQSPPGFLNIFELLNEIGIAPIALEMYEDVDKNDPGYATGDYCTLYTMFDFHDVWVLDHYYEMNKYPTQISLFTIQLKVHKSNGHQSLEINRCVKTYPDAQSLSNDNHTFFTIVPYANQDALIRHLEEIVCPMYQLDATLLS